VAKWGRETGTDVARFCAAEGRRRSQTHLEENHPSEFVVAVATADELHGGAVARGAGAALIPRGVPAPQVVSSGGVNIGSQGFSFVAPPPRPEADFQFEPLLRRGMRRGFQAPLDVMRERRYLSVRHGSSSKA
jgi:hypothetical protein